METIVNSIKFRIPRAELDAFRQTASSKGFQIFGDSGIVNFRGIIFKFQYNEPVLTIGIDKKPTLMSVAFIKRKLEETVGRPPMT
jgi:hypothetical protein